MPVWFPALCLDSATSYGLGWDDRAVSALFSAVSSPSRLAQACLQGKQESEREREREREEMCKGFRGPGLELGTVTFSALCWASQVAQG